MGITTYTSPLKLEDVEKLRQILVTADYDFQERPYAVFSAKKGKLNVTVYEKGPKVLVQGGGTEDFVRFILEPEILGEAKLGYEEANQPEMFDPHIGVDESGKGDFLGPLVIAGVYTDAQATRSLLDAGVMDSKRITSAQRIAKLAGLIRATQGVHHHLVSIGPERYNELYDSFSNLNRLLAWGHARVIESLYERAPKCQYALSDQFANPRVLQTALAKQGVELELRQRTKAESDLAVAAASILARERFLDWIRETSEKSGVDLKKGAGPGVVESAQEMVEKHGIEILPKIAKMHFKTSELVKKS